MQARGPLMIEHRLIERMIGRIVDVLSRTKTTGGVDPVFIDTAVDFIRTYADRTHHGKEEDIMFRDLAEKNMSAEDRQVMEELVSEHVYGREITARVVEANRRYRGGEQSALADIVENLGKLVNFYPRHIEKEDKVFFPAARAYLSEEEEQTMLLEFKQFDSRMIHEKYTKVVEREEEL